MLTPAASLCPFHPPSSFLLHSSFLHSSFESAPPLPSPTLKQMAVIPAAAGLVITGVFGLISVAQEVNKITEKKKPSNRLRKWSARYEVALLYAARFIPNMSGVEKDVYRVAYK